MINGISIPVPPIEEQKSIVAELDCLSGVIEREQLLGAKWDGKRMFLSFYSNSPIFSLA